jgi:predicted phosphodiesterase
MKGCTRLRRLAASFAAVVAFLAATWAATDRQPRGELVAFFLIGDTHLLATKQDLSKLDDRSTTYMTGLVDVLNKLPGTEIPKEAGGGTVRGPRGVVHAGDCIDTGDQSNINAQQTEWAAFTDAFGLTGRDGKLKLPLYEVHGNHDSPRGDSLPVTKIIERNKTRPGVSNISKNGLHYSWDWSDVHFINLGIVVGQGDGVTKRRRYDPLGSLEFLVADLREKVGRSGRPTVITHHVDMLRYAKAADATKTTATEWDHADVKAFHDALQGYNIAAILYGHTHTRNVFRWDGSAKAAKDGIPVFNVAKSSHYSSKQQGLFYLEIDDKSVSAREYQTKDGWTTGSWTPQIWTAPITRAGK